MRSNIIVRVKWKHNFIWVGRNVVVGVRVYKRKHLISCVCGQSAVCASISGAFVTFVCYVSDGLLLGCCNPIILY